MSEHYAAFISYSHRDARWAKWLQRALEVYRLPAGLSSQRQLPRRLGKVFRDREELSTGQNLGEHLTRALDQSDSLIVICSPNACASPWVAKEIEYFKAQGKTDRIFCLLVEGGAEALPEPLLTDAEGKPLEPLAADPRDSGDGRTLAKLKLVSGMLGLNLDQLTQREQARTRQRRLQIAASVTVFLGAIGWGTLSYQAYQKEQRDAFEVVRSLTPLLGETRSYIDKEALGKATAALLAWSQRIDEDSLISGALQVKAEGLQTFALVAEELGNSEQALVAHLEARDSFITASAKEPDNLDLAIKVAFADFYLGRYYYYEQRYKEAQKPLDDYKNKITELYRENPQHADLITESIYAPNAVFTLTAETKEDFDADLRAQLENLTRVVARTLTDHGENHRVLEAAYVATAFSAEAILKSCLVSEALPYRERALDYARSALDLDTFNRDYKIILSNALYSLGGIHMLLAEPAKAVPLYLQVDKLSDELLRGDPHNKYIADRKLRNRLKLLAVATYHPDVLAKFPLAEKILEASELLEDSEGVKKVSTTALTHFQLALFYLSTGNLKKSFEHSESLLALEEGLPASARDLLLPYANLIGRLATDTETAIEPIQRSETNPSTAQSCIKRRQYWAEATLRGDYDAAKAIYDEAASLGLVGSEIPFFAKLLGLSYETPGAQ